MTRVAHLRSLLLRAISVERVLQVCASEMDIDLADLRASTRKSARVADDRHVAAAVMHAAGCSPQEIGEELGRDRTTVMHGIRQAARRPDLAERVRVISARLGLQIERRRGRPPVSLQHRYAVGEAA